MTAQEPSAACVHLHDLMPESPEGVYVTAEDAQGLLLDAQLYGNTFLKPTGEDRPTHRRISPQDVKL